MHPGWQRIYKDGTIEDGRDVFVDAGIASWRHGRCWDIACVRVSNGREIAYIAGAGQYWQADQMSFTIGGSSPAVREVRNIQRLITKDDALLLHIEADSIQGFLVLEKDIKAPKGVTCIDLGEHVGKWLTVSLHDANGKIFFDFKDQRL